MKHRLATQEDLDKFFHLEKLPTMKAWVGEVDGEPLVLAGVARILGKWFVFCDIKEEARKHKYGIARNGFRLMEELKKMGIKTAYLHVDRTEPTAIAWASTLGFEPDQNTEYYKWRA